MLRAMRETAELAPVARMDPGWVALGAAPRSCLRQTTLSSAQHKVPRLLSYRVCPRWKEIGRKGFVARWH